MPADTAGPADAERGRPPWEPPPGAREQLAWMAGALEGMSSRLDDLFARLGTLLTPSPPPAGSSPLVTGDFLVSQLEPLARRVDDLAAGLSLALEKAGRLDPEGWTDSLAAGIVDALEKVGLLAPGRWAEQPGHVWLRQRLDDLDARLTDLGEFAKGLAGEPGPDDRYEHLGPVMRSRLDTAEQTVNRVGRWMELTAQRSESHRLLMRELALVTGLREPPARPEERLSPTARALAGMRHEEPLSP